jgi:histidine ammonia-lyase
MRSPIFSDAFTRPFLTTAPDVQLSQPQLGSSRLTVSDVAEIARGYREVAPISDDVAARMAETAAWVAEAVDQITSRREDGAPPRAFYGINTGFGALAGRSALASRYLTEVLGRNLIASHAVGVGPYFDEATVRAAMLIRAQSLAQGRSGVRPAVVDTLRRMLNARVYPAVPELGSLGASGDLAPHAHLLLSMSRVPLPPTGESDLDLDATDGEAFVPATASPNGTATSYHVTEQYASGEQTLWTRVSGATAMASVGGKIELRAKEALALVNGSTFSAAVAALALRDAMNVLAHAELAVAMTLEGIRGFRDPFLPQVHQARAHNRAGQSAARVLRYVEGSQLLDPGHLTVDPKRVPPQDAYSVRCAAQVLGTAADALELVRQWVEMEVNAATDNPLIFLDLERDYKTISGGNFHGVPIAMAMDFLAIAVTDVGSTSERRMFTLTNYDPEHAYMDPARKLGPGHGLSQFLVGDSDMPAGLNNGLMMLQATAAALISDCKTLAHPDSVDSIPSSGNQEDHVSMSLNAARHARDVVRNVEQVVALELICAAQAISLQRAKPRNAHLRLGGGTGAAYAAFRSAGIAALTTDRVLYPDIRRAIGLVRSGSLLRAVGGLDP